MNWKEQKQKQIIDDYKYEIGISTEKGKAPTINIEKESARQNEIPSNDFQPSKDMTIPSEQPTYFPISEMQELQSSESKNLFCEASTSPGGKEYHILDKSTGKTESLNVGNIDLSKQSPESLKKLLSGQQTEMTTKSGASQMVGLSKTPAGWGLLVGKQAFSMADSSAEI